MGDCTLNKYGSYNLESAKYDDLEKQYVVKLLAPPSNCSIGIFTTHKAELKVDPALTSGILSYSKNHPVIQVPSKTYVQHFNTPEAHSSILPMIGYTLFFILGVWCIRALYKCLKKPPIQPETYREPLVNPYYGSSLPRRYEQQQQRPETTIINNNPGNGGGGGSHLMSAGGGFLAGMAAHSLMSDHPTSHHSDPYEDELRRRRERDEDESRRRENQNPYSANDSYSSQSSSSDDSGSSYDSSSSSDSFSSDSGSSFSSDSGSSFTND